MSEVMLLVPIYADLQTLTGLPDGRHMLLEFFLKNIQGLLVCELCKFVPC
jgi:hypothetical protein